jgi:hypothetical protein
MNIFNLKVTICTSFLVLFLPFSRLVSLVRVLDWIPWVAFFWEKSCGHEQGI